MTVLNWSEKVEGLRHKTDAPVCGGLYKDEENYIVTWSGTDPNSNMNCFSWSIQYSDCVVPRDQYNESFNNSQGPIHNVNFRSQTLKEKRKTDQTCTKYAGSAKFNSIPKLGNPEIPINSYKNQCREHIISNGVWGDLSLPDPHN